MTHARKIMSYRFKPSLFGFPQLQVLVLEKHDPTYRNGGTEESAKWRIATMEEAQALLNLVWT